MVQRDALRDETRCLSEMQALRLRLEGIRKDLRDVSAQVRARGRLKVEGVT